MDFSLRESRHHNFALNYSIYLNNILNDILGDIKNRQDF